MSSTSTENIDPILGRHHKTLPISITFPNANPSHGFNYGSKGIWTFSRQHHRCPEILPDLGLKSSFQITMRLISIHKLQQNFIHKNFVLLSNSYIKIKTQNPSRSLHYDLSIILTQGQYIFPSFLFTATCLYFSLLLSLSLSLSHYDSKYT